MDSETYIDHRRVAFARAGAAALLCIAILLGGAGRAQAQQDQVALVKVVDGQAFALRADQRSELGIGAPIFVQDVVETEAGSIGLTFKDGSRISIGPNSRVQFTQFDFTPTEGRLAFIIDIFRGTLHYISGVIAKLSPDAVQVRTPVATVAVRGTRFLVEVEGD
ncbi:FecR domain-containing protein [Pelagibius sp. CAU 1746]|uniref:FecR family protein n=1 Tax=Pelagibius sp. CAU 1746 TaxID=3140370 RepID=UPI00325B1890